MGRKALFFDIDGTLVSEITGVMPESAERAIARTRKAGNLVFINTGRTMGSMKAVPGGGRVSVRLRDPALA